MIQIHDVPDDIHRALVEKAEREGMSLSGFLLREVTSIASLEVAKSGEGRSLAEIMARAEQRKPLKPVTEDATVEVIAPLR